MTDKNAGESKFEQSKGGGKADDLNGLGGDLLSKPKATEKTAEKAVDTGKDTAQQAKDSGDKVANVAKATDVTDSAKEKAMTDSVMGNLNKSVGDKVAVLNTDEGKKVMEHPNGHVAKQFSHHFKHLPVDVQNQLQALDK